MNNGFFKLSFLEVRLKMMSFLKLAIVRIWNIIVMPINVKQTFLKDSRKTLMEIAGTVQFVTLAYMAWNPTVLSRSNTNPPRYLYHRAQSEKNNILMLLIKSKIVSKIQERKGRDFKFLTFSVQILELLNKN